MVASSVHTSGSVFSSRAWVPKHLDILTEMSPATLEALTGVEITAGLRWGAAGAIAVSISGLIWRRWRGLPAPFHGMVVVVATLLAMSTVRDVPRGMWEATGLLMIVGLFHPLARRVPFLLALLAVPGAWWLAVRAGLPGETWVGWYGAAVVVVGAPLIASFDDNDTERSWGPGLWLVTAAGVFAAVPDTGEALVLLGASIPVVLLGWPLRLARIGPGAYPLVAVFVWVAAWGGRGRPASIVAVTACLGILLIEPIIGRTKWARGRHLPSGAAGALSVGATHLVVVLIASRWAAGQTSVAVAALVGALALLMGAAVLVLLLRQPRKNPPVG